MSERYQSSYMYSRRNFLNFMDFGPVLNSSFFTTTWMSRSPNLCKTQNYVYIVVSTLAASNSDRKTLYVSARVLFFQIAVFLPFFQRWNIAHDVAQHHRTTVGDVRCVEVFRCWHRGDFRYLTLGWPLPTYIVNTKFATKRYTFEWCSPK